MGGKGKRRREKNYKAAHGDHHTRLPPPPDPSQLDAVPSKLRRLFSFSTNPDEAAAGGGSGEKKRKRGAGAEEGKLQKSPSKDGNDRVKFKGEDGGEEDARDDENNKKKKKRKRGQVEDLRFEAALEGGAKYGDKRRERKKKFLEAKKLKKNKKKKGANAEEESDFPGRERIRFGDVVQAPPKLVSIPKAAKAKVLQSAYKERLRLEVIDAYRQKRGWNNRPGLKLPSLDLTPAL